jgi:mono/diheme cytochrome c family protein
VDGVGDFEATVCNLQVSPVFLKVSYLCNLVSLSSAGNTPAHLEWQKYAEPPIRMYNTRVFFLSIIAVLLWTACESNPYQMGERLYKTECANCHMDNGEGLIGLIPPLAKADYLNLHRDQLPCLIRKGIRDSITVNGQIYVENMAGLPHLSDIQITNILNYVNTNWENKAEKYRLDEVRTLLEACE